MTNAAPRGSQPTTEAVGSFDTAARGYDPAAVDARVADLTAGLAAAERRARALEAELTRLKAGVPRADRRPLPQLVAGKLDAIMLPAEEDARRQIAEARAFALGQCEYAEGRVAELLARTQEEAKIGEAAARQAHRFLVAQAEELAEQIHLQSAAAEARVALCAPEIVIGARRLAMQVATWSLARLTSVPRPARPRPSVPRPAATPNRSVPSAVPRTSDSILTITSST